ncbi:hypothetical protein AV656_10940 [Bhargavaea cecembensis]|uniref:Uncharacterized protein n=1 Tax=Bhargavaea cecembensis TaxID=394098 RepID=A0A161SIV0_9BACL|nr:hypothetical protein AV656_10940 [Bhargavaea cecembensis]
MFLILRWAAVLLFILIGSFLFTLTFDGLGFIGNTVKAILGVSCFYIAGLFMRRIRGSHLHKEESS